MFKNKFEKFNKQNVDLHTHVLATLNCADAETDEFRTVIKISALEILQCNDRTNE